VAAGQIEHGSIGVHADGALHLLLQLLFLIAQLDHGVVHALQIEAMSVHRVSQLLMLVRQRLEQLVPFLLQLILLLAQLFASGFRTAKIALPDSQGRFSLDGLHLAFLLREAQISLQSRDFGVAVGSLALDLLESLLQIVDLARACCCRCLVVLKLGLVDPQVTRNGIDSVNLRIRLATAALDESHRRQVARHRAPNLADGVFDAQKVHAELALIATLLTDLVDPVLHTLRLSERALLGARADSHRPRLHVFLAPEIETTAMQEQNGLNAAGTGIASLIRSLRLDRRRRRRRCRC
jgi:hypothetical protein